MPDQSSGFNLTVRNTTDVHDKSNDNLRLIYESQKGYCRIFFAVRNGRKIAYKALRRQFVDDPIYTELLRKEYEIGHTLYHPGIVSVIGFETLPDLGPVILMEYVDGITLKEYLATHAPLKRDEAENILLQIESALSYLHSHSLIHRDLKPANIMLTFSGKFVKIIDFGLSDGTAFSDYKYAGGTTNYSAPEQLAKGIDNDPRADIYSIGKIMQDMIPDATGAWRRVAERCCMSDPDLRPDSVDKITATIRKLGQRRRYLVASVAAIAALLISIGGIVIFQRQSARPDPIVTASNPNPPIQNVPSKDTIQPTIVLPPDSDMLNPFPTIEPAPSVQDPDIQNIAEEPTLTPQPNDIEADNKIDETIPLEETCYQMARKFAAARWKYHVHAIDTMKSARSVQLAIVGHWRHLAKEDFGKWLSTKVTKNSPYYNQLVDMAYKTIRQYEDENIAEQGQAWQRANKNNNISGAITYTKRYIDRDRIRVDSLMEDGTWYTHIWDESVRRALRDF